MGTATRCSQITLAFLFGLSKAHLLNWKFSSLQQSNAVGMVIGCVRDGGCVCVRVCLCVRVLKGKRLELSTPNLVDVQRMAVIP